MSPQAEQLEISEMKGMVAEFLASHPDFFEQHAELLLELELPHTSGGTVSLIERQLAGMREKCAGLEQKLETLIEVGRKNDLLMERLHRLTLALIETINLDEVLNVLEDHLHQQFQADAVELKLFTPHDLDDPSGLDEADQLGLTRFEHFFAKGQPACGRLTRGQLEYLFGPAVDDIQSTALLMLKGESIVGMLAIGSSDEDRFQYDMGTEFLRRLSEIVSARLEMVSEPGA